MVVRVDTQTTNLFVVFFIDSGFVDSGVDLPIYFFLHMEICHSFYVYYAFLKMGWDTT